MCIYMLLGIMHIRPSILFYRRSGSLKSFTSSFIALLNQARLLMMLSVTQSNNNTVDCYKKAVKTICG